MLAASSVSAATWYLSPAGSDSNSGTTTNTPFATIMQAQTKASSGDIVFIMAGTYNLATNVYNSIQDGVYASVNLISKNGITYEAVPGTHPVFNFSAVNPAGDRVAAFWVTATGVTFQGFDVVGVQENITAGNNQSLGFGIWGCKSCTWNQVNVHDSDCVGFYGEKACANNLIYRCDSYNNTGIDSYSYGNADGFGCHPAAGGTNNIFRECRAWNNSDDGYDCLNAAETVTFDHCWSYLEGNNGGNGNGFKVGGWGSQPQNQVPNPLPAHIVFNCLSAKNGSHGFYANHQPGRAACWTNNTSYGNSSADFDMLERTPPNYSITTNQTDAANDIASTNEVMHYNLAFSGTLTGDYNETGCHREQQFLDVKSRASYRRFFKHGLCADNKRTLCRRKSASHYIHASGYRRSSDWLGLLCCAARPHRVGRNGKQYAGSIKLDGFNRCDRLQRETLLNHQRQRLYEHCQ